MWQYFDYLLRSRAYDWELRIRSKGIWTSRLQLTDESFLDVPIVVPTVEDAELIARFLRGHDQRVRRLIAAKRRLIELLNERRQAIIQQAVTRGLDPNVRLKPSGIDWLGEVPEHWQVASLARFAALWCDGPFGSGLKSLHYTSEGVRVVRLQNIGMSQFRGQSASFISPAHYATLGDHDVLGGDLLVAGLGEDRVPAGRACVAPLGVQPAMVKADCFRFRLRTDRLLPEFASYQLTGTAAVAAAILSTGATRQRVNLTSTATRAVAIPPVREQEAIVTYLSAMVSKTDIAIQSLRREIDLIREYRVRLIADIVTGKVDVRDVELPVLGEAEEISPVADELAEEVSEQGQEPEPVEEIVDASD
jgi:type I restriction enzyme S subunit